VIPREAGRGGSFCGAGMYYLHDKGARTSERVAFTHCENVPTQDPEKALKWMAYTAIHAQELKRESGAASTGRPCSKPVFTFSLSWHPEQEPHKWEMIGAGRRALIALGLQKHETVMVAHSDCDHPHLHLIVSVIDPETGKANRVSFSKQKLSKWAEEYEREHGKIYCDKRVENNQKRTQGQNTKYEEPPLDLKAKLTKLYQQSDSGAAFQAALTEEGFTLAQGKRLVLIDRQGKIHSLSRHIEGVKATDIRAKLQGLELPSIEEARQTQASSDGVVKGTADKPKSESATKPAKKPQPQSAPKTVKQDTDADYVDRDQQDRDWAESIIYAAIDADEAGRKKKAPQPRRSETPSHLLNSLQNRHHAELGRFYSEKSNASLKLEHTLEHQYGKQRRELQRDIEHLDGLLRNSGRARLWWLKVTGQVSRTAKEDLQNMRLTLENIQWREAEARQSLDTEMSVRRCAIEARHRKEAEALHRTAGGTPEDKLHPHHAQNPNNTDKPDRGEDIGPAFEF
jgi:hypothetical protein